MKNNLVNLIRHTPALKQIFVSLTLLLILTRLLPIRSNAVNKVVIVLSHTAKYSTRVKKKIRTIKNTIGSGPRCIKLLFASHRGYVFVCDADC